MLPKFYPLFFLISATKTKTKNNKFATKLTKEYNHDGSPMDSLLDQSFSPSIKSLFIYKFNHGEEGIKWPQTTFLVHDNREPSHYKEENEKDAKNEAGVTDVTTIENDSGPATEVIKVDLINSVIPKKENNQKVEDIPEIIIEEEEPELEPEKLVSESNNFIPINDEILNTTPQPMTDLELTIDENLVVTSYLNSSKEEKDYHKNNKMDPELVNLQKILPTIAPRTNLAIKFAQYNLQKEEQYYKYLEKNGDQKISHNSDDENTFIANEQAHGKKVGKGYSYIEKNGHSELGIALYELGLFEPVFWLMIISGILAFICVFSLYLKYVHEDHRKRQKLLDERKYYRTALEWDDFISADRENERIYHMQKIRIHKFPIDKLYKRVGERAAEVKLLQQRGIIEKAEDIRLSYAQEYLVKHRFSKSLAPNYKTFTDADHPRFPVPVDVNIPSKSKNSYLSSTNARNSPINSQTDPFPDELKIDFTPDELDFEVQLFPQNEKQQQQQQKQIDQISCENLTSNFGTTKNNSIESWDKLDNGYVDQEHLPIPRPNVQITNDILSSESNWPQAPTMGQAKTTSKNYTHYQKNLEMRRIPTKLSVEYNTNEMFLQHPVNDQGFLENGGTSDFHDSTLGSFDHDKNMEGPATAPLTMRASLLEYKNRLRRLTSVDSGKSEDEDKNEGKFSTKTESFVKEDSCFLEMNMNQDFDGSNTFLQDTASFLVQEIYDNRK